MVISRPKNATRLVDQGLQRFLEKAIFKLYEGDIITFL